MRIIAINVGANTINPGFRGAVYSNGSFRFVPIKEEEDVDRPVKYSDLGLGEFVKAKGLNPSLNAHYDPEFETFTYGHVKRGFGDKLLCELKEGDHLMFFATLDYYENGRRTEQINPKWGAYIIGDFVIDQTPLKQKEFQLSAWAKNRFQNNAHLRRIRKQADLWISGSISKSKLLKKAFPLSSSINPLEPNEQTRKIFLFNYPKTHGWYRWTLCCSIEDFNEELLSALKSYTE